MPGFSAPTLLEVQACAGATLQVESALMQLALLDWTQVGGLPAAMHVPEAAPQTAAHHGEYYLKSLKTNVAKEAIGLRVLPGRRLC